MNFINTKDLIGDEAFANSMIDRSVSECYDDIVSFIPPHAFRECNKLIDVSFPNIKSIGEYAFYRCNSLTSASFPSVTSIDDSAFYECAALKFIDFPLLSCAGWKSFSNCTSLEAINIKGVCNTNYEAFNGCTNLKSVYMPNTTIIEGNAFQGCKNLTDVYMPAVKEIGSSALSGCSALREITLPCVSKINNDVFTGCSSLESVTLSSKTLCEISKYDSFSGTPIANGTGYIYVPGDLADQYMVAENWTKYASQIKAFDNYLYATGNVNIAYNNSRSISIEYCSPDATPVITVVSDNDGIATVGEVTLDGNFATFNVNALGTEGVANITVTMTIGDETFERTFIARVFETVPASTYSIEAIDGADYGFVLNSSNYYESQNNGVGNSYSICKVSFFSNGEDKLYLDCISYGQSYYDYGILSNIDTELAATYIVDADENIYKNFYGLSSADVQTVDYGVPEYGDHFIYVKYRKNNSTNKYNDSLQFKVRFATGGDAA